MAGTSDDDELVTHYTSRGFHKYQKMWAPNFGQKLNIKREKTNLFYPYAMGRFCELKGKFVYTSQTSSWENIPMLRIFLRAQRQA